MSPPSRIDAQAMESTPGRTVTIVCGDDYALAGTVFEAAASTAPVALVAPAAAVPRRFYFDYAAFLADHGLTTLTWDWRGIAGSRYGSLRGFPATMSDWARRDLPAVIDWATDRFGRKVIGVGHSFGGQAFGLAGRPGSFDRVLLLASQSGYWRHWPSPDRYLFRAGIGLLDMVARVVGYLPARRFGFGEDLPKQVALEWFSWCRSPRYLGDYDGHRALDVPVRSLGFTDDGFAPVAARRWLLDRYGGGDKSFETLDPADHGFGKIGHFSYFRRHVGASLWRRELDWLRGS